MLCPYIRYKTKKPDGRCASMLWKMNVVAGCKPALPIRPSIWSQGCPHVYMTRPFSSAGGCFPTACEFRPRGRKCSRACREGAKTEGRTKKAWRTLAFWRPCQTRINSRRRRRFSGLKAVSRPSDGLLDASHPGSYYARTTPALPHRLRHATILPACSVCNSHAEIHTHAGKDRGNGGSVQVKNGASPQTQGRGRHETRNRRQSQRLRTVHNR